MAEATSPFVDAAGVLSILTGLLRAGAGTAGP
jgi:hypothetical protein